MATLYNDPSSKPIDVAKVVTPVDPALKLQQVPATGETKPVEPTLDKPGVLAATETAEKPDLTQVAPSVPKRHMTYAEMVERLSPYRPKTPEELEEERKKYKRRAALSALGDGLSAMANLFFTTKGAPNAWNAANSMSSRMNDRLEKIRQERETNAKLYFDQYLKARQRDDEDAAAEAARVRQQARDAEADRKQRVLEERQAAKDRWEARTKALQNARLEGIIEAQQYDTERKKIDAEYEAEVKKSQIAKNNRTGTGGGKSGSGATKRYPVFDADGNIVDHVYTEAEAVQATANNKGSYPSKTSETESESDDGFKKTTRKSKTTKTYNVQEQGGTRTSSEKDNYKRGGNSNASKPAQQSQKKKHDLDNEE
jgi:hypothetical protein